MVEPTDSVIKNRTCIPFLTSREVFCGQESTYLSPISNIMTDCVY